MSTSDGTVLGTTQVYGNAPRDRAFNVVLLAEGFRDIEQTTFDAAVDNFVTAFTATAPFDRLTQAINVFRVNVSSTDCGASNPNTSMTVHTYFDATFGTGKLERLLTCNDTTALTVAAAQVPEFSVCLVVVNSTTYGGSGGGVGTFSLAGGATKIAIHEMGHTAFGLADEYNYWAGDNEPDRADHPAGEPSEPNVTLNTDRATLKWSWAVAPSTPLPTTSNVNCAVEDPQPNPFPAATVVGCYEGAHYYHCGAYRPQYDCKMRTLNSPFCRICESTIMGRIAPQLAFIKVAFFDLGGTLVGDKRDWIPGAKDTLSKMLQKGVRLGLISNTKNLSRPEILEILPKDFSMSLFENQLVIFSSEVHIEKPDPQIFKLAIMRAGVQPSECLFCTEELPHILVAKQEGMQTALLQAPPNSDVEKLTERLTSEGLLPK